LTRHVENIQTPGWTEDATEFLHDSSDLGFRKQIEHIKIKKDVKRRIRKKQAARIGPAKVLARVTASRQPTPSASQHPGGTIHPYTLPEPFGSKKWRIESAAPDSNL